ncbi:phosphate signaling complex protein PhoU [Lacticigenium naphthae]|uniref:phosphate signaling complex protein PhoU n=1 Tax=Lacticigenium naphthae TaxID=515351 RepID=UPI0004001761|nr:phosphate signaling complex protein PhoU [Lacticigenium naphthae]
MRRAYEEELNRLHASFFRMGRAVNEAIHQSVKAFVNHDKELAKKVIEQDKEINEMEHELEQACIELIALQQPVTTDLRKIITVMKASADLERMGDHAVSISKSTIRVKGSKRIYEIEAMISEAGDRVEKMVQEVLDAFVDSDDEKAIRVANEDLEIDELTRDIHRISIEEMKKDPDIVLGATDYMLASTYVERIGDYVTNISEWILYLNSGKIQELNTHHNIDDLNN